VAGIGGDCDLREPPGLTPETDTDDYLERCRACPRRVDASAPDPLLVECDLAWAEHLLTGRVDAAGSPPAIKACIAAYLELRLSRVAQGIPLSTGLPAVGRRYAPEDETTPPQPVTWSAAHGDQ
jgi:hypothetical protein